MVDAVIVAAAAAAAEEEDDVDTAAPFPSFPSISLLSLLPFAIALRRALTLLLPLGG